MTSRHIFSLVTCQIILEAWISRQWGWPVEAHFHEWRPYRPSVGDVLLYWWRSQTQILAGNPRAT
jgi:hypothetical protein